MKHESELRRIEEEKSREKCQMAQQFSDLQKQLEEKRQCILLSDQGRLDAEQLVNQLDSEKKVHVWTDYVTG